MINPRRPKSTAFTCFYQWHQSNRIKLYLWNVLRVTSTKQDQTSGIIAQCGPQSHGWSGASMRQSCIYNEHSMNIEPFGILQLSLQNVLPSRQPPKCSSQNTRIRTVHARCSQTATDTGHNKELPMWPLHTLLTERWKTITINRNDEMGIAFSSHGITFHYYALFMFSQRKPQNPVTHSWANPQIPNDQASKHGPSWTMDLFQRTTRCEDNVRGKQGWNPSSPSMISTSSSDDPKGFVAKSQSGGLPLLDPFLPAWFGLLKSES